MSVINNGLLLGAGADGYTISRSVRLRSSASAYLTRTPAGAGNQKTWTWSAWVKRGSLAATNQILFSSDNGTSNTTWLELGFDSNHLFYVTSYTADVASTVAVFRDPSAWYHIVVQFDSTQASAANRCRIYFNGVQQTLTGAGFTLNANYGVNAAQAHDIGRRNWPSGVNFYCDLLITEVNFIDGQALTPSSFGETDAVTGVWKPKKYAGTYGTNGFYLNFSDNSGATATTIGKDYSGNGNNWTPNNISVTAGSTYDSMIDSPTMYADGGNGRGNYAALNPLAANSAVTAAQGNLSYTSSNDRIIKSTISVTSGKWYWEFAPGGGGSTSGCGAINPSVNIYATVNLNIATAGVSYLGSGNKAVNGTSSSYGATYTSGNTIGVALDLDTNAITFYKDNTSQGSISITSGLEWCPAFDQNTGTNYVNFGQRPFTYTPPTGFKALNTQNLPDATIKKGNAWFDVSTWTGNASTPRAVVSNLAFSPDLVWTKDRSVGYQHSLQDTVRGTGASKKLYSSLTEAENGANSVYGHINSFDANGFTVATGSGGAQHVNASGVTYVGWSWKAGGTAVSNTAGTITSSVSANPTAGFSVATYTGNGSSTASFGHGLGVAPSMVIIKNRTTGTSYWPVYHASIPTLYLSLNATAAGSAGQWISTSSTLVSFSSASSWTNSNTNNYVAYCFAPVAGYSKFGSYTGNGSADGPFVFLGFRPRWVLVKRTDTTGNWLLYDTLRLGYNQSNNYLLPDLSNAEGSGDNFIDVLSNGFKARVANQSINTSGGTYIFAAFAENPFKNSLAR